MMKDLIREKLESLNPTQLHIIDESYKHHGHQPNLPSSGTHFKITVVAECFKGKSKIARHRIIYDALKCEFKGSLHALSIKACSPEEMDF
ncbi:MAG: BolA family transcriptional regulator [Rickettsiaceae bacterium]|jgi:BolA protein|nr:BolA family transcriptional regulator [Rickettsiaceae bacterium]